MSGSLTSTSQSPLNSPTQLRLVLLGRTGSGKSAAGNTILGTKCFQSNLSMSSVTNQCQKECGDVQGQSLAVIDTPGWFDTSLKQSEINHEVLRGLAMCSPGPHAFLLIIPIARFTEEQQQTVDMITAVFKENINRHTIIIFTRADELEGEPIEQFIAKQDKIIQDLIARFGGRFLAFNNKNPENRDQVKQLLKKLDELLKQNEYRHFTNQETEVVEKALLMLKEEKLEKSIEKAKQEVRQIGERRKADINKEQREKASNEDESKWCLDEKYFTILKYIIFLLGVAGAGLLFRRALFPAPAVPVDLLDKLNALLRPELAAPVIAVAAKAVTLKCVATEVPSLCFIQ